jgi:hypothetical protein
VALAFGYLVCSSCPHSQTFFHVACRRWKLADDVSPKLQAFGYLTNSRLRQLNAQILSGRLSATTRLLHAEPDFYAIQPTSSNDWSARIISLASNEASHLVSESCSIVQS